ncbi:AbrB/MazE/SpoVT family DNA-binding domain-containing protein [Pleomorphomonas sp. JP5]|uniref:AbrB/MazE/SpoVT family DNA-binding domain-containing protein n=1 Tax=Pleomorphomonas sp. JP5 TaxID=2942998 RepID=UPI0020445492|nr:AbrB/MazE/SpoVT family DNA-binding domain-containing protein [Pleomorphomonas sp. JP5]MCM5557573.1 type II toxin-antitoxin system PrlF family antitoxin [Pleomorphomonas sp. JP5]
MITGKLTAKGRTTIPLPVRQALRLREGDEISYSIEGNGVTLRKGPDTGAKAPFGTFNEWDSDADRTAYRDL